MKLKIFFTILLFLFSVFYIIKAKLFLQENDQLMNEIKNVEKEYFLPSVDAFLGKDTMIPGLSGKKINLKKTYQKMKKINKFSPSLLVYDKIKPQKSINNNFDKIIISGNQTKKRISIILDINNEYLFSTLNKICVSNNIYVDILSNQRFNLNNTNFQSIINTNYLSFINYCLSYQIIINKECINNHKYTFLGHRINNYFLSQTKDILHNGIILVYQFNQLNYQDFNLVIKYLKNNNYEIVSLSKLIIE